MREATYTGTAAFPSDTRTAWTEMYIWQGVDTHIWTFLIQSWRSVVLKNIKPEINRPKSCKTQLPKYIQSDHDYDATEQKRRPERRARLWRSTWDTCPGGGRQKESNENDLGSERRPQTSVNNSGTPQTSVQTDMNNLKTSNLYKYYKSIDSIK